MKPNLLALAGFVLVFLSVSFFASAEPVYINSDTVLNSAYISGNSSIGAFVINSSNITVNLAGSTLTRNLTWFDGSTIFSSNSFQNVTIKDGVLNWSDWGRLRVFITIFRNTSEYGAYGDAFALSLINGFDSKVTITFIELSGSCSGSRTVQATDICRTIQPGASCSYPSSDLRISDVPSPGFEQDIILCSENTDTYSLNVSINYNISVSDSSSIASSVSGFVKGRTYNSSNPVILTYYNDFLLNNSDIKLFNVTFNGSKFFWTNFSDSASNLSVGWYLDVQVNDSNNNPIQNANVTATDKNSVVRGNGTTDSNGRLRFSLPEYVQNSTGKNWKSNYTITASHGSLTDTKSLNLTDNSRIGLTLNNTAPTVNLISINGSGNNSYTNSQNPNIQFNFTDLEQTTANCEILINGSAGFGASSSVSVNTNTTVTVNQTLGDGLHNVSVRCHDGISYGYSATWVFTVDTILPDLNMTDTDTMILIDGVNFKNSTGFMSPNNSPGVKDNATIDFRATEDGAYILFVANTSGSLIRILRSGTLTSTGRMSTNETWYGNNSVGYVVDGLYTVLVNLTDLAGNKKSNINIGNITVDNTAPQGINATKNQTAIYKNNYVNFSATWTDANLSGYIFSINQTGTWVNFSFINFSGNNVSNYTIQINASGRTVVYWKFYAQDLAGNWNSGEEQNFTVIPTLEIFINQSSWDLGLVQKNSTTVINSAINVTNLGDVNESFMLRILNQDNQSEWSSSALENGAGNNTYVMSGIFVDSGIIPSAGFFNNESNSEDVITTTNKTANSTVFSYSGSITGGYSIIPGSSAFLWLRFDSPTITSGTYAKYSHAITIQIAAVEA